MFTLVYKESLNLQFVVTKPNHVLNHMGAVYLAIDLCSHCQLPNYPDTSKWKIMAWCIFCIFI